MANYIRIGLTTDTAGVTQLASWLASHCKAYIIFNTSHHSSASAAGGAGTAFAVEVVALGEFYVPKATGDVSRLVRAKVGIDVLETTKVSQQELLAIKSTLDSMHVARMAEHGTFISPATLTAASLMDMAQYAQRVHDSAATRGYRIVDVRRAGEWYLLSGPLQSMSVNLNPLPTLRYHINLPFFALITALHVQGLPPGCEAALFTDRYMREPMRVSRGGTIECSFSDVEWVTLHRRSARLAANDTTTFIERAFGVSVSNYMNMACIDNAWLELVHFDADGNMVKGIPARYVRDAGEAGFEITIVADTIVVNHESTLTDACMMYDVLVHSLFDKKYAVNVVTLPPVDGSVRIPTRLPSI